MGGRRPPAMTWCTVEGAPLGVTDAFPRSRWATWVPAGGMSRLAPEVLAVGGGRVVAAMVVVDED